MRAEASVPVLNLNLRLLQTFMLVAENLSFREAAEQTHRSQSAVSTQIKQLEAQLGTPLLHRTTRSVNLTAAGAELYTGIRSAMLEIGEGLRNIQECTDPKQGRVRLACSPTVAAAQLPRILASFEQDYPAVRVHLTELHSDELCEAVRQGDVDFGIGPKVGNAQAGVLFEVILNDPLMALMHRDAATRRRGGISMRELAGMPLLLHKSGTTSRFLLEEALQGSNARLNSKYECTQGQTLVAMAEAGLGTAILPRSVIKGNRTPATRAVRIVEPEIFRQIAIVTAHGRRLLPAAARLAQLIRERIHD
ncbi:LysR family transcriptional regulator [Bordetella genomosp. 10]|nr:LysR family transcriptional regulator [Bordetella genomosp. 10]